MMFARQTRRASDDERILPLINVVFLLLIFFMLAGRISAADPFKLDPPSSASEGLAEDSAIVVQLAADGRLAIDGKELATSEFVAALKAKVDEQRVTDVRLKADGGADARDVVAVMERMRDAGVARLRLLTVRSPS